MKFLHAADLHIDSPMRGLARYDEAPLERLRLASRAALANLVDLAIEEDVVLVVLAGDVFDGNWPHYGTGLHFAAEMGRLQEAGIEVAMVSGNHDAESVLTKGVPLPANVRRLDSEVAETVRFEGLGVAVHGQSYATPAVLEDLSAAYPPADEDLINIGILHTCAEGRVGHEPYAPCRVEALIERGYEYWALGHVHAREVLSEEPAIVFPGILQGRGVHEHGAKGAVLVEFDRGGVAGVSHRDLDVVRWDEVTISASGCATLEELYERLDAGLRVAAEDAGERLLATRVKIEGRSELDRALRADPEGLRYEAIATALAGLGERVWIERVEVRTSAERELEAGAGDALGEVLGELESVAGSESARADLAKELAPFAGALPARLRESFDPSKPETIAELVEELAGSLTAKLLGPGGE